MHEYRTESINFLCFMERSIIAGARTINGRGNDYYDRYEWRDLEQYEFKFEYLACINTKLKYKIGIEIFKIWIKCYS